MTQELFSKNGGALSRQEEAAVESVNSVVKTISADQQYAYGTLLQMLTYKRPHGSKTERRFISRFLMPLGLQRDRFGNMWKIIGDNPTVMWSSHTDTVHTTKGMQLLGYDKDEVGVSANEKNSNCLGADDAAGVWLMHQMITENVPGLYIFHRAEEGGRKGSIWLAKNNADLLKGVKYAIALDRRLEGSIITHQSGDRCCSEEFSKSLAAQLGMDFKSDDTGSFTDTASYVDLIGECTNISVGYKGAHGQYERQDVKYLFQVRDALMKLDASKLEEKRKPGDKERKTYTYGGYYHGGRDWQGTKDHWKPCLYAAGTQEGVGYAYIRGVRVELDTDFYDETIKKRILEKMGKANTQLKDAFDKAAKDANAKTTTNEPLLSEDMFDVDGNLLYFNGHVGAEPGAKFDALVNNTTTTAVTKADQFAKGEISIHDVPVAQGGTKDDDEEADEWANNLTGDAAFAEMTKFIAANAEAVADIMESYGFTLSDLREEVFNMYGSVKY